MDDSILDGDQVENLLKFCPTKEEMETLKVCLLHFTFARCDSIDNCYIGSCTLLLPEPIGSYIWELFMF